MFPTYVQGICAQSGLWRSSKNYKDKTFAAAIAVWSGGNNVEPYIKFVLDRVITPYEPCVPHGQPSQIASGSIQPT
ncbi:hypothetical protein AB7813_30645 [Tardiphaga sp. 20_F10_N6_6]|uniref:hypothetical protein n=1 Tax=Tardiphaga sp. 20_F10_N6_6 TaxID=3240788 RepID=UPI003F886A8A